MRGKGREDRQTEASRGREIRRWGGGREGEGRGARREELPRNGISERYVILTWRRWSMAEGGKQKNETEKSKRAAELH